jgi:Zn ribbon nucleic-acid-binding protein
MDTIVVDMDADLRECVDCGFQEGRPQAPVASELPTRVSRGLSRRTETPAEPVRLMDPSFGVKKDS